MPSLSFEVREWLGARSDTGRDATLAAVALWCVEGEERTCLTEVYDTYSQTVRNHINVSALELARWTILNWWRLRWEPVPLRIGIDWRLAHTLAAIGEGYAWPPLTLSSDGAFIQLQLQGEARPDAAGVRYLYDGCLDIAADAFEVSVDEFVSRVLARLSDSGGSKVAQQDLRDLQDELNAERSLPDVARACRLQALAGFQPGDAPSDWLGIIDELGHLAGRDAIGEIAAVLPSMPGGLGEARDAIDSLRQCDQRISLGWVFPLDAVRMPERPWQKGCRIAKAFRKRIGKPSGQLTNVELSRLLGAGLPMRSDARRPLDGGYRDDAGGLARISVPSPRIENQRFHLARVMASALLAPAGDRFLAVTRAGTAMQKCERAFAQELLCPWADLDAFTDERGVDDEAIADAADHFQVSDWTVLSALVNNRKIPRDRLPLATA